jgi:DNA-binding NtrC family response regulator
MTAATAKGADGRPKKEIAEPSGSIQRPGLKVLIVEDDVAVRKGLDIAIRDLGGQTRCVGTAGEAARAIADFQPEVLVVDVHLPDGDGIEVFRAANEANPDRDGIVITGQASLDSAVEALPDKLSLLSNSCLSVPVLVRF